MLQMSESGHDCTQIGLGLRNQAVLQTLYVSVDTLNFVSEKKADIKCYLIVTTAACVELASHFTNFLDEKLLNCHVHVFLGLVENESTTLDLPQYFPQTLDEDIFLFTTQKSLLRQHLAMSHTTFDIVTVETLIEPDRGGKTFNQLAGSFSKPTLP
jgi:hypothetical protein